MTIYHRTRTGITVKETETIDQALRKFKRKVEASGKLMDVKNSQYYEKPTTVRKREKDVAKARLKKKLAKESLKKR
jgi:small subunit ribosomal protein S21